MISVLRTVSRFARTVRMNPKAKPTVETDPLEEEPVPLETSFIKTHNKEDRADPETIQESELTSIRLNDQHLPMNFLKRVQQILHKYDQSKLREIVGLFSDLMRTKYKQKKFNYTQVLPFQRYQQQLKHENKVRKIYLGSEQKELDMINKEEGPKKNENPDGVTNQYTQNVAMSYLIKRVPRTFASAVRVLIEIQYRFPKFKPTSMIDFGSGLSSGSSAFVDVFGDSNQVYNVEPSSKMFKLSRFLVQDTQIQHYKSLGELVRLVKDVEIVFAGYVLNEIEGNMIPVYLEALYNKVRPGGFLVILQYGNPFGARLINDVRNWARARSIRIQMPCPHQQLCPLSTSKRWCHFDQPAGNFPRNMFGALPSDQAVQSQKFSYLVLRKSVEQGSNDPISNQRTKTMQDWDRVVFPTMRKGGHAIMELCTTIGTFQKRIVAKSHGEQYKAVKKLRWGDLWKFDRRIPNKFRKEKKYGKRIW